MTKIPIEAAEELRDLLQAIMGFIDLDQKEKAKQAVRRTTDYITAHVPIVEKQK